MSNVSPRAKSPIKSVANPSIVGIIEDIIRCLTTFNITPPS